LVYEDDVLFTLDRDPASPERRTAPPPTRTFQPTFIAAKRLNGSRCHLARR